MDISRDIGRLEATVESQGKRIDHIDTRINDANDKLDALVAYNEQQKGGARIFIAAMSLIATGFGALASMIVDWIKRHP